MGADAGPAGAGKIAIIGGGPSGLVLAMALARRGVPTTVFERDLHPEVAPRFNPDRSYTIDISGHGLKAIRHIAAEPQFDERMIKFKGLKLPGGATEPWDLPGWTGSRGDILRALMAPIDATWSGLVTLRFEHRVTAVDIDKGTLTIAAKDGEATEAFDFIVGADGAGSVVRKAFEAQVPGFRTEHKSLPNWCTMIELDRVGDTLDPNYLHGLSSFPFVAAGAIRGDKGSDKPRWFCAIGTREKKTYASPEEARAFFRERVPRILELTSDDKVAAYAARPCYHIGQKLTCSQIAGGKAVLIGDSAGPFPPIGQGVNAAMESAMVLDLAVGEAGASPEGLLAAAKLYNDRWKPEIDAVSWMSEKSLFENRWHMMRARIAGALGISIFSEAKSAEVPYSAVKRKADRIAFFWT